MCSVITTRTSSRTKRTALAGLALVLMLSSTSAQSVFFSDSFNRANNLDLDAVTNGMTGMVMTNGAFAASNVWLEPIDLGRNVPADTTVTNNTMRMGGNGHSVNIVLDRNFATLMSTGVVSVTVKLNGTPGPNDGSAIHRYEGVGFGFARAEGNVVSATVDRVLSRAADVFVAGTANGRIRINDEAPSLRPTSGDVAPTLTLNATNGSTTFVPGTLRLDFNITNAVIGSTNSYTVLFDAGSTGSFVTLTNRTFVLSDNHQLYTGLENRSTPILYFDDFAVSAIGTYGPPVNTGVSWRAQVNNTWDTSTTNWLDTFGNESPFADGQNVRFDDTTLNPTVSVTVTVSPGSITLENISSNYTFAGTGVIAGTASLSKMGSGIATLNTTNTYSGGSSLSAGRTRIGNDSALGIGQLTLGGGTLSSDSSNPRLVTNAILVASASTLGDAVDAGTITFTSPVNFNGAARGLTIRSPVTFDGGAGNGRFGTKQGAGTLIIRGTVDFNGASDVQDGTVVFDGATVTDTDRLVVDAGSVNGIARLVITNGAAVTVSTTAGNLRSGRTVSTGTNYMDLAGLFSLPNADSSNGNAALQANAAYSEMTFLPGGDFTARGVTLNGASTGTTVFRFNGGILRARNDNPDFFEALTQIQVLGGGANFDDGGFAVTINRSLLNGGGGGGLNKIGAGTLRLNASNTYQGATIVSNGAFGGAGTLSSSVVIMPGATLTPGNSAGAVGLLTIGSNLTLSTGSFVLMDVDKGANTNDVVNGLNDVGYEGTLVITNVSGAPFADGDAFTLFNFSGAKTGSFGNITILPPAPLSATFDPTYGIVTLHALPAGTDVFTVSGNSSNNVLPVLTNDPGAGLTLLGITTPTFGTAAPSGTNILYAPDFGFVGSDVFTYTNQDSLGSNAVFTVIVHVSPPPNLADRYQVLRNSTSNQLDVLRNDGPGATLVSLTQPANGTSFISGTNILYTPNSNYVGPDGFSYTLVDGLGVSFVSTVTLDVRQYPNFVFILADDQGWAGLSVPLDKNRPDSKSDYYRTPRMETLASQGMRFSMGYAPHPNCSPSRYANLTGQNVARLKMTDIIERSDAPVSGDFKLIAPGKAVNAIQAAKTTIPELLKSISGAGYSAAHFGKWHLGGGGPASHGFDSDANDGATANGPGDDGPEPINPDPKHAYTITDRALAYLDSRVTNGAPFYLQASHYAVHETTQASQSSYDSYTNVAPGIWHTNRYYAAMTTDLDINVGRLLDKLDELGIRNSTYIFYQGDNGAPQSQSENYPLRGYKPEVWEGGTRTPTFIRGPGVPADSQCTAPVMGIDLLPTIWEWTTGSTTNLPADVDGGSLVTTINSIAQGSNSPAPVTRAGELVHHSPHYVGPSPWPNDWQLNAKDMRPRTTIHDGNYKLVANYEPGTIELYDLDNDIGEMTNLSPAQLAIKWQLWVRLRDYLKLVGAQMPTLDPTYPGTTNGAFVLAGSTGPLGDADSDSLNDDWEFRELLTYQFNDSEDADQDGVSNAQELAQGTDPLLPNAYQISSITQVAPDQLQLTWNATPGASFIVESSTDLLNWSPATTVTAGNDFSGSVTVVKTQPQEFFRVRKL